MPAGIDTVKSGFEVLVASPSVAKINAICRKNVDGLHITDHLGGPWFSFSNSDDFGCTVHGRTSLIWKRANNFACQFSHLQTQIERGVVL
jgi:hypothetical protein